MEKKAACRWLFSWEVQTGLERLRHTHSWPWARWVSRVVYRGKTRAALLLRMVLRGGATRAALMAQSGRFSEEGRRFCCFAGKVVHSLCACMRGARSNHPAAGGGREQDRLEALQQCAMDGAGSGACMAGRCSAAGAAHAKEMPKKQQLFRLCGVWRMGRGTAVPQARGSIVAHFIGGCVLLRGPAGPGLLLAIADTDSHVNQSGMGDVRGLCQFAPLAIGALAAMHPGWG